ncbi:PREDICTED: cyclin-related protein FAM58A-like [Acropora digitifera]|uniref:cyclin-related protein FAM58A-like n=1 Tax=Acropora digitifera TaxID=70779 RepID=UPI00077A55A0|nr:PREDICTED: cyclin-related protein FAM58A-like [Acropora digitifera]
MNELRPTECSPFRENLAVTKFIMDAGHRLKLTPVACASACVLYHRVMKKCNSKQSNFRFNDATLVGSTALYLASKMEECPCKLRDVINFLLHYLLSLGDWLVEDSCDVIGQLSWVFLQDSFHKTLCLQLVPSHVAVAMLYFALNCLGVTVPCHSADNTWWKALCSASTEEEIQEIVSLMIDFYSRENMIGD